MTVSRIEALRENFLLNVALGDREIASDWYLQIVGEESIGLLMKGFSVPFLSTGEPAEVPLPVGQMTRQGTQINTSFQSGVQFNETQSGALAAFSKRIIRRPGGRFDAYAYSGTPTDFGRVLTLRSCLLQLEPADVDFENRSSLLLVSGTISYNYFGEDRPGPRLLTSAVL